jgi:acetyl esterase/lipase
MSVLTKFAIFSILINICLIPPSFSWHFLPSDVSALHNESGIKINYGPDKQQFGVLRLPKGQRPFPVIIIIHGGCWVSTFAQVAYTNALSDALRDNGFATWNIEYRQEDNGGGYPTTFLDVSAGADFLRNIAKQYNLNLKQVLVIGHSAGGHLALWLVGRHNLPPYSPLHSKNPLPVRGVIALGAPPDLASARDQLNSTCGRNVTDKLKPFSETSPINLLPLGIPQILIYGNNDQSVPFEVAKFYIIKAHKVGDNIETVIVKDCGHHEYCVPNSIAWPTLITAVKKIMAH